METGHRHRAVTALCAVFLFIIFSIPSAGPASADDPRPEGDPCELCLLGIERFLSGESEKALPLLEAGFSSRTETAWDYPGDLGKCALYLGILRGRKGDLHGALEAYGVALDVFRNNGYRHYEGITLGQIGSVYRQLGRHAEALETFFSTLQILEEANDRVNQAIVLTKISATYADQARYPEALEVLWQALDIFRELGDLAGEAEALSLTGQVYLSMAQYSDARELLQQALAIHIEAGDEVAEALDRKNIGVSYFNEGHYREALESLQTALEISRQEGARVLECQVLGDIIDVYRDQGLCEKALDIGEQACTIADELGIPDLKAKILSGMGAIYGYSGYWQEELEMYEQALAIYRESSRRFNEGRLLCNIGMRYTTQGHYGEALEMYQQALVIAQEIDDRKCEMAALLNTARVCFQQGQLEYAMENAQRALYIAREIGDRPGEGEILVLIGQLNSEWGLPDAALDMFQQALMVYTELDDPVNEAKILAETGLYHIEYGLYDEALTFLRKALDIFRRTGRRLSEGTVLSAIGEVYLQQGKFEESMDTLSQALLIQKEIGNKAGAGETLYRMGRAYQLQGLINEALNCYEQAMEALEEVRAGASSESGKAGFIARYSELYEYAVGLYHRQGQDKKAFITSERGRSRAFLDSLMSGHVSLTDNEYADLLDSERAAYSARQNARDALIQARAMELRDPVLIAQLETQLAEAEERYREIKTTIEGQSMRLATLISNTASIPGLPQIQSILDERTTLVSFFVIGEEGTLAFIITRDDLKVIDLPEATEDILTAIISELEWYLRDNLSNPHPGRLQELHAILIAPLIDYIHTPLLGIVPHQQLHYVPFTALSDGREYLSQRFTLFTLPSASSFTLLRQAESSQEKRGALIFGNPATDEQGMPPLPHATSEVESISELFDTRSYIGADASEARLRSEVRGRQVLHLAAHSEYNPSNPLYSTIYLAPGSLDGESRTGEVDDGHLEVREVYGLDISEARLVVLSACETNIGRLSKGDEVIGLTRAFHFAGAPTVISTLWHVSDAATEALMVSFYRHAISGLGYAEALQAAQTEVRENPQWRSPFYWSCFVLNGDPGQLAIQSRSGRRNDIVPIFGLVIIVGFIMTGFFIYRNKVRKNQSTNRE